MKMAQMRQLLSAGSSLAGTISNTMQQQKQDGIANTLMDSEAIPRAQAVDSGGNVDMEKMREVLSQYPDTATMGDVKPATGGEDEMKLRFAMEDQKMQKMQLALRGEQQDRLAGAMQEQARIRESKEARAAYDSASETLRQGTLDAQATFKNLQLMRKELVGAQTQDEYDHIATAMASIVSGAQQAGVPGVEMPMIPQFVPPEKRMAAEAAAAAAAMRSQGLGSMPGYSLNKEAAAPITVGTIIKNSSTGARQQWDGAKWVPLP